MKIRSGFVSNSSSASFILKWKSKKTELDNVSKCLNHMFRGMYWETYLEKEDMINSSYMALVNEENKEDILYLNVGKHSNNYFDMISDVMRNTTKSGDIFETKADTFMFNDYNDFGPNIEKFTFALVNNLQDFEIVSSKIADDELR